MCLIKNGTRTIMCDLASRIDCCKYMLLLNLKLEKYLKKCWDRRKEDLERCEKLKKIPDWNIPQENRFTGNR